jgi:predicted hydrocarbon binding protein
MPFVVYNERIMITSNARRESLAGGHVKGSMVRAHLKFVRDRFGDPVAASTVAALPPAVAAEIDGALASSWCTFESLVSLDRAIARACGREENALMRELGRYSAQINLSTVYRAFRRDDIHDFFRRGAALHRQFQDFGTTEYEQVSATRGRIRVRDASCYSPAYCASESGYLEEVIAIHGGKDATIVESTCQCANDAICTFELQWH